MLEVCILTVGHSRSALKPTALAALPPTCAALARACSLLCAKDFLHQSLETRLVAHAVVNRINL